MGYGTAETLAALAAAVDAVLALHLDALADAEVGPLTQDLIRQQHRLAAGVAGVGSVFDSRGRCRPEAAPSSAAWLRRVLNLSPGDAAAAVRAGRTVRDLPATAGAFAAGD